MLPSTANDDLQTDFTVEELPTKTYTLNTKKNIIENVYINEIAAMKQAIFLILSTQRYAHVIYSDNFGTETNDLIGAQPDYAMSEIKRMISEALLQDSRINTVTDFDITRARGKITASFTVSTIYGDVDTETEVSV